VTEKPLTKAIEVRWPTDLPPVMAVNQFAVQLTPAPSGEPEAALLMFGLASPPVITGTPEAVEKALEELTDIVLQPVGRIYLTRERMQELLQVLSQAAQQWDAARAAANQGARDEPAGA
jgi:hypothetical protein